MSAPIPVTLVGATGLTGAATLNALLSSTSNAFGITTIARKAISTKPASNPQTTYTHNLTPDLFEAPSNQVAEKDGVYISCLGTTRAIAGGLKNQEKIDVDLNRDLAKRAKADGARQIILVSSSGAASDSRFPYLKMKGVLDDAVQALDFDSCVILRPGMLLGPRNNAPLVERVFQHAFRAVKTVGLNFSAESEDIGATIAYYAANPPKEKVVFVDNAGIVKTAKQWRDAQTPAK